MSPSPQPFHGQANSASATVDRAIGPVLVLLLVTVALAVLSAPAAGHLVVVSGSASHSALPAAADTDGTPITGNGLATVTESMSADPGGDGSTETQPMADQAVLSAYTTVDYGVDDGRLAASSGDDAGADVNAVADKTGYREVTRLTAESKEGIATQDEAAGLTDPLVLSHTEGDGAYGADSGSSDYRAMSEGATGSLQGERFERPWGLNPSAPVSPATVGGIAFGFLLGAGAFAVARPESFRNGQPISRGAANENDGHDQVTPSIPEDDHVPDEAIVEGILLSQDGRMKQSAIVDMTNWSKAKVSRVLSAMADDGSVVKVRLGRENLICLDGWEPDALKHPHAA